MLVTHQNIASMQQWLQTRILLPTGRPLCGPTGIRHEVIVAEQLGTGPFNRGALLNIAFLAAEPGTRTVAIVDIDMLPLPGVNFSDVGCVFAPYQFRHVHLIVACDAIGCSIVACHEGQAETDKPGVSAPLSDHASSNTSRWRQPLG